MTTSPGPFSILEAERDAARLQVNSVAVVLEVWKADQHPIMSLEVSELIGEIEKAMRWPDHAALLHAASQDILREERDRYKVALESLRRSHLLIDEDCWYSCPAATYADGSSGYCGPDSGCNCGADEYNARIDAALFPAASPPPAQREYKA